MDCLERNSIKFEILTFRIIDQNLWLLSKAIGGITNGFIDGWPLVVSVEVCHQWLFRCLLLGWLSLWYFLWGWGHWWAWALSSFWLPIVLRFLNAILTSPFKLPFGWICYPYEGLFELYNFVVIIVMRLQL